MNAARLNFPDAAHSFPEAEWKASWIWTPKSTSGKHDYVYFRDEFTLKTIPGQVLLRIAAERDATLWINGKLIAYGPPISDPRFKRYETHDITSELQSGPNCVAVRVYHDSGHGAFTDHANARGLLCQIEADGDILTATGTKWRAVVCRAYQKPSQRLGDTAWPEIFDANQDTPGWTKPDFDDSGWPAARPVIARVHPLWGEEQPQTRFFPWIHLIPCETRPLERIRCRPDTILNCGEVIQQRETNAHETAIRMSLEPVIPAEKTQIDNADALISGKSNVTIRNSSLQESDETFDGLRCATIVLDFGKLMNARLGFRITTSQGAVDIGYASRLDNGRVVPYVSWRTATADHYIARNGSQSWQSADWRHFRYVQLTFRDLPGELVIEDLWAEEIKNGFPHRGIFQSSDEKLNRMFEVIRRTAELNIVDRTMDNPSRERRQYLGDCSGIVPAVTSCFGDTALLRRYFTQALEGQNKTGAFAHSYPGHATDIPSLFDHSLSLPLRIWEHYMLFADPDLAEQAWPGIEQFLKLAISCLNPESMITLPPTSVWFDWAHMDRRGFFLPLQAMTAHVMRCSAQLADALDKDGSRWQETADAMISRIPNWFDEKRGVFADAIVDGVLQQHISEHANALVALWSLAPPRMIQHALQFWGTNFSDFGRVSPAWMYLPAAFIRAGRPDLGIQWMHEKLDVIESQGLNTWPETWCLFGEKTLGKWRCRNSRAVAQGAGLGPAPALLQDLCGIQPAEPGFAAVRFAPQPGPLASLQGTQPGPDGDYSLNLDRTDSGWNARITLPSPRRVILDTPFAPQTQSLKINGKVLKRSEIFTMPNGTDVSRFVWQAEPESILCSSDPHSA